MKKIILASICAFSILVSKAQIIIDTVSIGTSYANQKWYSLQNDEQGVAPKNNWDIAFDCSGYGSSILINSAIGTALWNYPNADTAGWNTIDTSGISTWTKRFNSDTSWTLGAFSRYRSSNPYDVDWGIYSSITHFVTGDSLYIIKLSSGIYKKLWVQQLAGGAFTFKYADLNGSGLQNVSFFKSPYAGKNFGYYSLQNNSAVDREPLSADWDLLFTQYIAFIPSPYSVSGVLSNKGVKVAEVNNVANTSTYDDWSTQTYLTPINEIGYDWKAFSGSGWTIEDSLVYFIKTNAGDIWKIVFTGFGGSSTGNYIFSKEKLNSIGINDITGIMPAKFSLYPIPSNGDNITIVYDLNNQVTKSTLILFDLTGKVIYRDELNHNAGLHTYNLNTTIINPGMYIISIGVDGKQVQQKLLIN